MHSIQSAEEAMFLSATAMVASCVLLLSSGSVAQFGFEEDVEEYKGRLVGTFNSYHHQVNGEVYAVDDFTMLIRNFVYDGNGKDTFFWAGGSSRPGTQGFIVPNESGRTNVLKRSTKGDFTSRNFNHNHSFIKKSTTRSKIWTSDFNMDRKYQLNPHFYKDMKIKPFQVQCLISELN